MTLIDDNDLSGQPQMPQHHVLLFQRRHQELIDRANHQIGQQSGFSAAEE